jgi:hypothetical protein
MKEQINKRSKEHIGKRQRQASNDDEVINISIEKR